METLLSFRRYTPWVTISVREIVGGVDRHRDLVAKKKIANFFFPGVLVIRENLCSRKFPAIRYAVMLLSKITFRSQKHIFTYNSNNTHRTVTKLKNIELLLEAKCH